jgi:hypothetical protein
MGKACENGLRVSVDRQKALGWYRKVLELPSGPRREDAEKAIKRLEKTR